MIRLCFKNEMHVLVKRLILNSMKEMVQNMGFYTVV